MIAWNELCFEFSMMKLNTIDLVRFDSLFTFGVFKSPRYINKNNFISSIT